jgi:hypothetical protein
MGVLWPRSNSIEWYSGSPALGAKAYFYEAGTSTPRAVYEDAALGTPHDHPVLADGNGRWPAIFLSYGDHKETITTSSDTQLWTTDDVSNPEPFDDTFELDETAIYNTGDYIFAGKNGTRDGAVRCNGRTIGNAASGGTERANADTAALFAYLWNNYANGQAAVSTGRGATAVADYAANKTIALPDHRGASLVGFDDMGNTAASLLGSAPVVSGSAILAGSIIGANTHALTEAQLASHTHTGTTATEAAHTHTGTTGGPNVNHTHSGTTANGGVDHTHTYTQPDAQSSNFLLGAGSGAVVNRTAGVASGSASAFLHTHTFTTGADNEVHVHSVTTTGGSAHSHTFTSAATGSGTAHNIVSRTIPVCVFMKL